MLIRFLVAALVVLATAGTANAATLGAPIDLQAAVSRVAGRQITITVDTELPGSWSGGAYPGLPFIFIGRDAYNDAQDGGGHGLTVLLHELGHTTGIENEAAANCYALQHLIPFMDANWETPDTWMHVESKAYVLAVGFMHAQSAIYQCPTV